MNRSSNFLSFLSKVAKLAICLGVIEATSSISAWAVDTLPYSTRVHDYSAGFTGVRGDIRTVGMSGATVGLADTFIASLDNPAGLAMTLGTIDFNFSNSYVLDSQIQNLNNPLHTYNLGLAYSRYPWGFSFGFVVPYYEGQPDQLSIQTRELNLSVARVFFDGRLSFGGRLILGRAESTFQDANSSQVLEHSAYDLGGALGASLQLGSHMILGMSYRLPNTYQIDSDQYPSPDLPGFFRSVHTPSRLGMGLGWIPNRFFRTDFSTFLIGTSPNSALLSDDSVLVGLSPTLQPRFGIAYNFLDSRLVRGVVFAGSYYEMTRIDGQENRIHGTAGFELKVWAVNFGGGIDRSDHYKNYNLSIGVDVIRLMQFLDIIPPLWHPEYVGAFPHPANPSEEGLPRTLNPNWSPDRSSPDPIRIGLQIPEQISKKVRRVFSNASEDHPENVRAKDPF